VVDTPPITRSSKTVIAASGFTYIFGLTSHKQMGLYDFSVYEIRKKDTIGLSAESPNNTSFTSYDITVNMVYRDTQILYDCTFHDRYERWPYD
jgi:hypothetical protein